MSTKLTHLQTVMAALYLRGAPRAFEVKRSGWRSAERAIRVRAPGLSESAEALRAEGLWSEALALGTDGLLGWAEDAVRVRQVLAVGHEDYPSLWPERLGGSAPPALWMNGQIPPGPYLAIVGSRDISADDRRFAERCAMEAVRLGYSVVSGAAPGVDRAAARGAIAARGGLLEILPFGIRHPLARRGTVLSACAPDEDFSSGTAMERNALIYALADTAIIVRAQFRAGGTWHGAIEAHRRRLTRLIVREDASSPAHRALVALGATPLAKPEDLAAALQAPPIQGKLVG